MTVFPPEFIPIELSGMSVMTAICLSFMGIGAGIYALWNQREHTRMCDEAKMGFDDINSKADLLFNKVDEALKESSGMRENIAGIYEAVDWIKKDIEKKREV